MLPGTLTVFPVAGAGKKRRRAVITDESDKFLLALLETPLGEVATAADVRRILAEELRAPVLVTEDFMLLSLACEGIIPLKILDTGEHDSAMPRLCGLLQFILDISVTWWGLGDGRRQLHRPRAQAPR